MTINNLTSKKSKLKTHRPKLIKPEIADLKAHYEQAYKQAIYEVYNGQEIIQIQIGKYCPALDFLIVQGDYLTDLAESFGLASRSRFSTFSLMDRQSWALITASNPYSQTLTELENQQRHYELMKHLEELQLPWLEALGRDRKGIWTPEHSFWISGIERVEAIAIGCQFEQNAIVYGELNQPVELQWL